MSPIECFSCGHRMLLTAATQTCTNCGARLQVAAPGAGPEKKVIARLPARWEKYSEEFEVDEGMTLVEPYYHQHLELRKPNALSGYEEEIAIRAGRQNQALLEPWTAKELPRGFPRHPPELTGIIINVQTQMETPKDALMGGSFFKQIVDALWPLPYHERTYHEKEKVQVTMVRVRTGDGLQKDARLEGYLRRAGLGLGDRISFWGRQRQGVLLVHKGYNHTSKGVVSTTSTTPLFFIAFLFIVGLALLYYLLSRSQTPIWPWP